MIAPQAQPSTSWFAFNGGLRWDGTRTPFGGTLAFLAIWRQVWHADDGPRQQLRDERESRQQERQALERERERRKCAIARALAVEMAVFRHQYIETAEEVLKGWSPRDGDPLAFDVAAPFGDPFPVYRAGARKLGEFEEDAVQLMVRFYGLAQVYVGQMRDAARMQADLYVNKGSSGHSNAARNKLEDIQRLLPVLKEACDQASSALEEFLGKGTASAVPKGEQGGSGFSR